MGKLEKLENARTRYLATILICSILLFFSFFIRIIYSWRHLHKYFPHENAFRVGGMVLIILMVVIVLWWRLEIRRSVKKDPFLRIALRDERVNLIWLRAYRLAFFFLLIIQIASKGIIIVWPAPWDVPYQSAFSLSAAIAAATGAFFFYSRETHHE
jgi:hypothetical protein